jgi:tetratricopeptide (TPR) repeat protein
LLSGDRVRITVQLVRANPEQHLWAKSYEGDLRDILSLQSDISRSVASEIRIAVTPQEEKRLADARSVCPEAHIAYLRGRRFWNMRTEESNSRAMELFRQAIAIDPSFALAYSGLADSYIFSRELSFKESSKEARATLEKALEIDGRLGEAHATLAFLDTFDYLWADAESGFQRAIEISPNYATAHHWYGLHLSWTGHHDEAIAELTLARSLDPLPPIIDSALGGALYEAQQYDRAIEHLLAFLRLDETFRSARVSLALNYLQLHRFEEALKELQALADDRPTPSNLAALGYAHALAGNRPSAEGILSRLIADCPMDDVSYLIARIYVALEQRDEAFRWLETAYERDPNMVLLKVDPPFIPLHSDPRFQDLLRRMNFPE